MVTVITKKVSLEIILLNAYSLEKQKEIARKHNNGELLGSRLLLGFIHKQP